MLWGGIINQPPDPKQTLVLGDFRKSVVVPGWAGPQGGGSLLIVELTPREPLLWWCKVHGSCCCVCLPWLEERRRWSSRRNGDLLSSYGQTKPQFSVPKQHPCPCRASHLELGKLRVADRAKEGIWAIANTLGQTEEHDCVCCSLSRVKVGAPALLGWQWTLLPAWVTKGVSEGRRAGEPQLAHGGGSRSPRRALCGQSCALPAPSDPAWG